MEQATNQQKLHEQSYMGQATPSSDSALLYQTLSDKLWGLCCETQ